MMAAGIHDMNTHCRVLFKFLSLLTQSIPNKVPFQADKGIIPILMVQKYFLMTPPPRPLVFFCVCVLLLPPTVPMKGKGHGHTTQ